LKKPGLTFGLVGYGRFGKLAARLIAKEANVLVHDKRKELGKLPGNVRQASLPEVAAQSVVILAVPTSALKHSLHAIARFLRPHALVLDVCSVKAKPAGWMRDILPAHVNLLGTHPLFGPSSVTRSVRGHRIVLCPIRISGRMLNTVTQVLTNRGMEVLTMVPRLHDRMIAETLFLTQFIGRMVSRAHLRRWTCSSPTYDKLLKLVEVADRDSLGLLIDLWNFNPFADKSSDALWRAHSEMRDLLNTKKKRDRSEIDS